MVRFVAILFLAAFWLSQSSILISQEVPDDQSDSAPQEESSPAQVVDDNGILRFYIMPVQDMISNPTLFIMRRGIKEAIASRADFIILDMNTPGGALGTTLEIMQMLSRFEGRTVTFVNNEAISAGAFISAATRDIYFAPDGVIGAAAPVMGGGQEIEESMRQKIVSYLRARIRAISEEHPYRGEVISAMVDADFELVIEGEVIKPKGELLTLTAREAIRQFGDPPRPLLGAGIVDNMDDLVRYLSNGQPFEIREFEVTWSVRLAQWLTLMAPLFLSGGLLLLFIEFKTPGFGIFGFFGVALMAVVFFGHHVAGLSGFEPFLIFLIGVALVLLEILLFPGLIFPAVIGILLMLGSLLWGMADIWPDEGLREINADIFLSPLLNLGGGVLLSIILMVVLSRFLPKSFIWDRLVLQTAIPGSAQGFDTAFFGGAEAPSAEPQKPTAGMTGVAATALFPSGEIVVEGRRYQARLEVGSCPKGTKVRILRYHSFVYEVEALEE